MLWINNASDSMAAHLGHYAIYYKIGCNIQQSSENEHLSLVTLAFLLGDKHHRERKADVVISVILTLIES